MFRSKTIGAAVRLALYGLLFFGLALYLSSTGHYAPYSQAHIHAPDLTLWRQTSDIIKLHMSAAIIALFLGAYQLGAKKGTPSHRLLGRIWLSLMFVAAASSLFIQVLNKGHFSLIHILSVATLILCPLIIYAARQGWIEAHRRMAGGLFLGGLIIAGALTFMPGRLIWQLFFD